MLRTRIYGGQSRDWLILRCAAERMLKALPDADGRKATVRSLVNVLDNQDAARRAGCTAVAATLWETCGMLACGLAGRWSV